MLSWRAAGKVSYSLLVLLLALGAPGAPPVRNQQFDVTLCTSVDPISAISHLLQGRVPVRLHLTQTTVIKLLPRSKAYSIPLQDTATGHLQICIASSPYSSLTTSPAVPNNRGVSEDRRIRLTDLLQRDSQLQDSLLPNLRE